MRRTALALSLMMIAAVATGCSTTTIVDTGYVTGKEFVPEHSYTVSECVVTVNAGDTCPNPYDVEHVVPESWVIHLQAARSDATGTVSVTQEEFDEIQVGDFYRP